MKPTPLFALWHDERGWLEDSRGGLMFSGFRHVVEHWAKRHPGYRVVELGEAGHEGTIAMGGDI